MVQLVVVAVVVNGCVVLCRDFGECCGLVVCGCNRVGCCESGCWLWLWFQTRNEDGDGWSEGMIDDGSDDRE